MPIGHKEIPWDASPDTSSKAQYTVNITQRDLNEIKHLVNRNFAGLTVAWLPAMIAITKILQQINDQDSDSLDNYDNDGVCPVCKAPEHEEID